MYLYTGWLWKPGEFLILKCEYRYVNEVVEKVSVWQRCSCGFSNWTSSCVNWVFIAFHCFKLAHSCHKKPNLHTNELNTTFFCSTSTLKAPNRLKSLKLAWRFVLRSCDIYQNPFTQGKILKFWQCWTKKLYLKTQNVIC
jgi:hypothetical protein